MAIRLQAQHIVDEARMQRSLTGLIGTSIRTIPMSVRHLADKGVPPNLTLPYDSEVLRGLVREIAQLYTD